MADHLNQRQAPLIALTPHPGEMARLLGGTAKEVQARRLDAALEAAGRWRAHVILKGFHTILATPSGNAYINTTGNPGMATAGTGDVLTGILAGLTAQFGTQDWARVLSFGVYLHGLAGDIAASRVGQAPLIASDLIEAIPEACVARYGGVGTWPIANSSRTPRKKPSRRAGKSRRNFARPCLFC